MSDPQPRPPAGALSAAISNDVVRILHEQTGRGPAQPADDNQR